MRASEEFEEWASEVEARIAVRRFYTSIAGVSFANDDGSDRQQLIAACREYDTLELVPEPENQFHAQAVKVVNGAGQQLGYLDRRCAQEISNKLAAGERFTAAFCERREAGHRPGQDHLHGAVIVIFQLNAAERHR
jgi:hypothetical protein